MVQPVLLEALEERSPALLMEAKAFCLMPREAAIEFAQSLGIPGLHRAACPRPVAAIQSERFPFLVLLDQPSGETNQFYSLARNTGLVTR